MSGEREPPGNARVRTSWRFDLISAGLAFVLWGGWAFYVNRGAAATGDDRAGPVVSGITQGLGSFLITLIMVRAVTRLYHRFSHLPTPVVMILPAVLVVSVTGSCLATAHALVGTADIARTIAPALSVALAFCVYTAAKLLRAARRTSEPGGSKEVGDVRL